MPAIMSKVSRLPRIGTAGWSIPKEAAASFPGEGQHLDRYTRVLDAVEINSSFYRSHRVATWSRWATQTPADFRFAVKVARSITHEARLESAGELLQRFLSEAGALGDKLAVLLVQLPPSLAYDASVAETFFGELGDRFAGAIVCEPRHASWFTPDADQALAALEVARAAADPADWPAARRPGGWLGDAPGRRSTRRRIRPAVHYYRWHGSPRMYWSAYEAAWLQARARDVAERTPPHVQPWCIFDNTAAGAAIVDALTLRRLVDAA